MESILLFFYFFVRDVVKSSIEKLEPFMNIQEQDGIYLYRIIILWKAVFVLYTAESWFPDNDTWLFFSVTNALTVIKYPPASALLTVIQCLIFTASSKKFALFSSTALFYILSVNIKVGEFLLDLYVLISLIMNIFKISSHEHQKLWTFSIKILIVCYSYNLYKYNLRQLSLIVCFLFLNCIPLRPNIHNWIKRKLLYMNALMLIWLAVTKSADSHEVQTVTGNFEFYKKCGYYESSLMSDNIDETKLLQIFRNPKMANISEENLTPKSLFNNLTPYSEIKENTCKADDENNENTKILDKNLKSLRIYESNLAGKLEAKNFDSMKLTFENECSKNRKFNFIYDIEALEENLNSQNFLEYFKENVLTPIDSENNEENYHSMNNNFFIKGDKERSVDKRSIKNYTGQHQNTPDKFKEYYEKKLSNAKVIECIATINEHNCSEEFKSNKDEKNIIPNVKEKNRMNDSLQNISRREKEFTPVSSDEIQKSSKRNVMQKVASFESRSIKSSGIKNGTFYERCLYEFSKLTIDEKIKQIEQMLIDVSKGNERVKVNLGSILKIEEDKHVYESENGSLQDKDLSIEKDTGMRDDGQGKWLNFQGFKEENNEIKFLNSTKAATKYRNDQKISLILDEDISLRNISDSTQKKETKNEFSMMQSSNAKKTEETLVTGDERNAYKPTRESKQLLIFNNKKGNDWLKNEKKMIKYEESHIMKDHIKPVILNEEITLGGILDSIQGEEKKNEKSSKSVSSAKETGKILLTSDGERNVFNPTKESKNLVIFSSRKYNEGLNNEKNVVEYAESLLNESIRSSKYGKNRLVTQDELKLYSSILHRETKTVGTLKKSEISKRIIQDVPHVLVFKTLRFVKRENNAQFSLKKQKLSKFNRIKKELKKEALQFTIDRQRHPKQQNRGCNKDEKRKFQDKESNIREKIEHFEIIKLQNSDNFQNIKKDSKKSSVKNPVESIKCEEFNIFKAPKRKSCTLYSLRKIIRNLISNNRRNLLYRENTYIQNT